MFKIEDIKHIEYDFVNSLCIFRPKKPIVIKNIMRDYIAYKMKFDEFTKKAQKFSDYNKNKSNQI